MKTLHKFLMMGCLLLAPMMAMAQPGGEPTPIPTVVSTAASSIASTSAVLGGNVTRQGGTSVTERGIVWATTANPTLANTKITMASGTGTFSGTVTGFPVGTLINFRAYAKNSVGTAYGANLTFTTLAVVPTVTTATAASVSFVMAALGGNVTATGGAAVTERGIVWGTASNPTTSSNKVADAGTGTGAFSNSIGSLPLTTLIYFRAYAINSVGTSYGSEETFTTLQPFAGGSGTLADPYQITNAAELDRVRLKVTAYYKLMNDVSLTTYLSSGNPGNNAGALWSPIGSDGAGTRFSGHFDGNGKKITGLAINRPGIDNVGLFGYIATGASVNDLGVEIGASIIGANNVGGLSGFSQGTITNCYASGAVSGTGGSGGVGGLIGNNKGTVAQCYANAIVTGPNGSNSNSGGFAGFNVSGGTISNCFAMGSLTAGSYAGGFTGVNQGTITKSYSTTSVSSSGSNVGGFSGYNSASITNCFWDTQTSGKATSAGGTGKTSSQMKNLCTFAPSWDFIDETANGTNDYWGINASENGGYPFISWQGFSHTSTACPPPTVASTSATSITDISATLGGDVTLQGGDEVSERGIVWATTVNPTTAQNKVVIGSGTGSFSSSVTLPPGTDIHFRAYAINSAGTSYGGDEAFATLVPAAQISSCGVNGYTRSIYQKVTAAAVTGATGYEFKLYSDAGLTGLIETVQSSTVEFLFSTLAAPLSWNTTYYVTVAAKIGSYTGAHPNAGCKVVIIPEPASAPAAPSLSAYNNLYRALSDVIGATLVNGADVYDFEIKSADTLTLIGTKTSASVSDRILIMGTVPGVAAGQNYKVKVRARINALISEWSPFVLIKILGSTLPNTAIVSSWCGAGKQVSASQKISATGLAEASHYTFAFYNAAGTTLIDSARLSTNSITIGSTAMASAQPLPYGLYQVKVRASRLHNGLWIYGSFSTACSFEYKNFSTVGLTYLNAPSRGAQLPTASLTANLVPGASQYRFAFYSDPLFMVLEDTFTTSQTNALRLSDTGFSSGTHYVKVKCIVGSLQGAYASGYSITIGATRVGKPGAAEFAGLVAYPNPSQGYITVSYHAEIEDRVEMVIYCGDKEIARKPFDGNFDHQLHLGERNGMYIIQVVSRHGVSTQKVMVVK